MKMLLALVCLLTSVHVDTVESRTLTAVKEKVNYGIGVEMARNLQRQEIDTDVDLIIQGLKDGLDRQTLQVPEEELSMIMMAFQHELNRRQMEAMKMAAAENEQKGKAFLAENAEKKGVITLPSGLQYKVLKAGSGRIPTGEDFVVCNYMGSLLDGTRLDSTEDGKPATFRVAQVIPGWQEALQLMPEGAKWRLFVPPYLAYGEKGADRRIGPNATLIFELELLSIGKINNNNYVMDGENG